MGRITKSATMSETAIPVLDKGFVDMIQVMGDDLTVCNAARVSFGKRSTQFY